MTSIDETAYPRLKSHPSKSELHRVYSPTPDEVELAKRTIGKRSKHLGFLLLLKSFQRLGYFPSLEDVPWPVVRRIATEIDEEPSRERLRAYPVTE